MDAFVTKTESALALEQALNQASQLQKDNVLGCMESLATQVRIPVYITSFARLCKVGVHGLCRKTHLSPRAANRLSAT